MQLEAKEGAKPLSAKSPIAGVVEVHSMIMESGVVPLTLVIEDWVGQRQTLEVSASARTTRKPVDRYTLKVHQKQEGESPWVPRRPVGLSQTVVPVWLA